MEDDIKTVAKPERARGLAILGVLHLAVTIALSWVFVVRLTTPNVPMENGLATLFPGMVILVLGLPFALTGIALIQDGRKVLKSAMRVDTGLLILLGVVFLLVPNVWVAIASLPYVVDMAILLVMARRPV